ncbi:MAG: flagellar biosynthesis protein FlhB [Nitrospira sp.]|nr:flagellar biosynthesis protein FlhB [Nitrospira sp.]
MAEDKDNKTEPASEKRKADARLEGNIAVSRDVTSAAMQTAAIGLLFFLIRPGVQQLTDIVRRGLSRSFDHVVQASLTVEHIHSLVLQVGGTTLLFMLPVLGGLALAGVGASLAQTGFVWKPSFPFETSRLNPITGLSRLLSLRSLSELIKSLLKITVIAGIGLSVLRGELERLPEIVQYDVWGLLNVLGWLMLKIAASVTGAIVVVAAADYAYQRYEWERSLRMSLAEVKEEHRSSEGDPQIKSRVRSIQREMMKKRMMAAVPTADVVVTNPTHLAVALKYDAEGQGAPIVVAKGAGHVAERIRELARQHGVAVVENKFVARTLYKLVEVGKEIPADLYRAVAEILAFVYRARGFTPKQSPQ